MDGIKKLSFLVLSLICFAGCASTTLYEWGSYENSLYKYYKKPDTLPSHLKNLQKTVERGESAGKVPPGMYAEVGYAHLVSGDTGQAIEYFEKEKSKWPESATLMDLMITNANKVSARDSADNQGGASE